MPFNPETGIVERPLNLRDIGLAIGSSSNDEGTLCTHSNINKWAKYKPIAFWGLNDDTGKNCPSTSPGKDYWKGYSQNNLENLCGMNIPYYVNRGTSENYMPDEFVDALVSGQYKWEYVKPKGLITYNERYRQNDFDGYIDNSHAATKRPYIEALPQYDTKVGNPAKPKIFIPVNNEYILSLADFELKNFNPFLETFNLKFSDMYLGLVAKNLTNPTHSRYAYFTNSKAVASASGYEVVMEKPGTAEEPTDTPVSGTYTLAPFLYTKPQGDSGEQLYIGLDEVMQNTIINLLNNLVTLIVDCSEPTATGIIYAGIEVDNQTGEEKTIRRIDFELRYGQKQTLDENTAQSTVQHLTNVWAGPSIYPIVYPQFNLADVIQDEEGGGANWRDYNWWFHVDATDVSQGTFNIKIY